MQRQRETSRDLQEMRGAPLERGASGTGLAAQAPVSGRTLSTRSKSYQGVRMLPAPWAVGVESTEVGAGSCEVYP
jgi:hypothetical protein